MNYLDGGGWWVTYPMQVEDMTWLNMEICGRFYSDFGHFMVKPGCLHTAYFDFASLAGFTGSGRVQFKE